MRKMRKKRRRKKKKKKKRFEGKESRIKRRKTVDNTFRDITVFITRHDVNQHFIFITT